MVLLVNRRRGRARVRLHQRLPRHRQRRRLLDLDRSALPPDRDPTRGDPQLRRRAAVGHGRRNDRDRHHLDRAGHRDDRVRGPRRRDRLEPETWYLGYPVELLARADRRRHRRDARGRRRRRRQLERPARQGRRPGADRTAARVPARRDRSSSPCTGPSAAAPGTGQPRLQTGQISRLGVVARARHERRPEDDGRHLARAGRAGTTRALSGAALGDRRVGDSDGLGTYGGGWPIIHTVGSR